MAKKFKEYVETPVRTIAITPTTSKQELDVTNYKTAKVSAVASGLYGTLSATKGTVTNNQISVTPQISAGTAGYSTMPAASGTAVTVSASELVSGSTTITTNTTTDVTNLASVVTNVPQSIPTDIATVAEMQATLTAENEGKIYKYTGTTGSGYINGRMYVVEESTSYTVTISATAEAQAKFTIYDGNSSSGIQLAYIGKGQTVTDTYNITSGNIYVDYDDSKMWVDATNMSGGISGSGHNYTVTADGTLTLLGQTA